MLPMVRLRKSKQEKYLEDQIFELQLRLNRAVYVAHSLFNMIDTQTWRDTGGDDGQGHYEGEYRAERVLMEIRDKFKSTIDVTP